MNGKNIKESKAGLAALQGVFALQLTTRTKTKQNEFHIVGKCSTEKKIFFSMWGLAPGRRSQSNKPLFFHACFQRQLTGASGGGSPVQRQQQQQQQQMTAESLCGGLRFHSCFHMIKTSLPEALWLRRPSASSSKTSKQKLNKKLLISVYYKLAFCLKSSAKKCYLPAKTDLSCYCYVTTMITCI